jgi:putative ATP-dependent endonuclease of the OLD family
MEHVVAWIAGADEASMLAALGAALGMPFADRQALTAHLLTKKSYAPIRSSTCACARK